MFQTVGGIILDETVLDESIRQVVFSKIPRAVLADRISKLSDFLKGKQIHLFSGVVDQFGWSTQALPSATPCVSTAPILSRIPTRKVSIALTPRNTWSFSTHSQRRAF